jgi:hypothetical protein
VARGHFVADIIVKKILDVGYWWPTLFKDTHEFYKSCVKNWRTKNKKYGQVDNNISRGTFYEMRSRFYKSN